MNCPMCATGMIQAKATNFGDPYWYCRTCKKELSEMPVATRDPNTDRPRFGAHEYASMYQGQWTITVPPAASLVPNHAGQPSNSSGAPTPRAHPHDFRVGELIIALKDAGGVTRGKVYTVTKVTRNLGGPGKDWVNFEGDAGPNGWGADNFMLY